MYYFVYINFILTILISGNSEVHEDDGSGEDDKFEAFDTVVALLSVAAAVVASRPEEEEDDEEEDDEEEKSVGTTATGGAEEVATLMT